MVVPLVIQEAPLYLSGGEAGTGGYNGDVYIRNGTTVAMHFDAINGQHDNGSAGTI